MTREETIDILEEVKELDDSIYQYNTKYLKALDVAIESLKQEPKTGHWIMDRLRETRQCDKCMTVYRWSFNPHNYCPNCGCKMVEPQESEVEE